MITVNQGRSSRFAKTETGIPLPVPHRQRMVWDWALVAKGTDVHVIVTGIFDTQVVQYETLSVRQAVEDVRTLNSGGWIR